MHGLMQRWPLTVEKILDHAAAWRAQGEIVAPSSHGGMARGGYGQLGARARRLADRLAGLGLRRGETVAVIGFNTTRQLEAWYAIIGAGGVCQPLPPNLPADRLAGLLAEGGARIAFADSEILEALAPELERLDHVVAMSDDSAPPPTSLTGAISHDDLVEQGGLDGPWGGADEESPAVLVHTVGASGQAKGVVWSHRSCVLQGMIAAGGDGLDLDSRDAVLPLVPFWRAGAWGLVFAAPMAGAKLILPGPNTDAQSVRVLADRESATLVMGAPAELQALHGQYRAEGRRPPSLKRVIAVGAPTPGDLVEAWRGDFSVEIRSAWGSAETSGLGAVFDPSEPDLERGAAPPSAFAPTGRIEPLEMATAEASAAAMTPRPMIYRPLVLPPESGGAGDAEPPADPPVDEDTVSAEPTADASVPTPPDAETDLDVVAPDSELAPNEHAAEQMGDAAGAPEPDLAQPMEAEPDAEPSERALTDAIKALFAPPAPDETLAEPEAGEQTLEPLSSSALEPDLDETGAPFATARSSRPTRRKAPAAARLFLSFTTLLALTPPVLILVGAIGVREGLIDWSYGLGELMINWPFKLASVGLVGGILGLFAALTVGIDRLWRKTLASLLLPVAALAGLTAVKAIGESYPPVHQVATSWSPPIAFSAALIRARGRDAAPVTADPFVPLTSGTFMTRRVADVNAETCPGAHTAVLPATPTQAYALAKAAVLAAGLQLFVDDPLHGRLEAVATDPWLGFKDDLAVRVEADPRGPRAARVDMRSVSRNDTPDFGANCARVSRLIAAIGG
jgi:acyl-CoA synthetase (AMP-forming)/AMP-acid ligase II